MLRAIKVWLPYAVVLTFAIGAAYAVGHNVLRQSANDPQIQMAEDWAGQVEAGGDVLRLSLGPFIDPAKSLAPFGIVYNKDGSIANSSASAPTSMVQPNGVFASVDAAPNKEVRFTWQPESGARYATVIKRADIADKTYYVLAGRNLREVEVRSGNLLWQCIIGGIVAQLALIISLNLHIARRAARRLAGRTRPE